MNNPQDIFKFNQLFNTYYQQFIRFAMGYVKDELKAQDIVSDAFASYWETKGSLSDETNEPGYILTSVKNKCLNYLQHKKVKLKAAQEITDHAQWILDTQINTLEACNPSKIFSQEIQKIIQETIDKLPQKTQIIFNLSRFEHTSHRNIALQLNLSTKSIEYHISKALDELRRNLKDFLTVLILFLFL